MDEIEERPESLRMKKLKELIDQMSLVVDAPEEAPSEVSPELPSSDESPAF
jgi:hypothetical protein